MKKGLGFLLTLALLLSLLGTVSFAVSEPPVFLDETYAEIAPVDYTVCWQSEEVLGYPLLFMDASENWLTEAQMDAYRVSWTVKRGGEAIRTVQLGVWEDAAVLFLIPQVNYHTTESTPFAVDVTITDKVTGACKTVSVTGKVCHWEAELPISGDTARDVCYRDGSHAAIVDDSAKDILINFENEADDHLDAQFVGRVVKQGRVVLNYYAGEDRALVLNNPEAALRFFDFKDTTFAITGRLYLFAEEGSVLYEKQNGKLVKSEAKYDKEEGAFVLQTKTLGYYVISDRALNGAAAAATVPNPNTGAGYPVRTAAALAVLTMLALGAVSIKH